MFTRNFKQYFRALFEYDKQINVTTIDGESVKIQHSNSYWVKSGPGYFLTKAYCSTSEQGVFFGTDPTPATEADYKLGARLTSGLSIVNPSAWVRTEDETTGKVTYSGTYSVTNTSEAEINIYEIGIYLPVGTTSNKQLSVMVDRTVLTESIKIAPGETKVITYKLTFRNSLILE